MNEIPLHLRVEALALGVLAEEQEASIVEHLIDHPEDTKGFLRLLAKGRARRRRSLRDRAAKGVAGAVPRWNRLRAEAAMELVSYIRAHGELPPTTASITAGRTHGFYVEFRALVAEISNLLARSSRPETWFLDDRGAR